MHPFLRYRFSPSFKWPILALKGCAVLSSAKSCFCVVVCPSHLLPSFLVMVKMEESISIEFLSVTVHDGGCLSLGCWGYLHVLLEAHILLGTPTHFHRHLAQAHLLVMSLSLIIVKLKFHTQKLLFQAFKELLIAFQEHYIHSSIKKQSSRLCLAYQ